MSFLTIVVRDGGLGFVPTQAAGLAIIGVAGGGPTNQVIPTTDPKLGYTTYTRGQLPDRIAHHFGASGPGPVYALRAAGSTAGSIPSYALSIHAAHREDGADIFPSLVTATLTWLAKNPRNVEIIFAAGWQGGDVTIVGTGEDDSAITEVIADVAGSTVKGNRVFKTITSVTKEFTAGAADTATVQTGNKSTEGASSTTAKLAISGTPTGDFEFIAEITRITAGSGDAAADTALAFKASFDGGETYTAERAIPAGAAYTGFATEYGLTLTFTGLLRVGDEFRQNIIGPSMTSGDLSAALAVLHADDAQWEVLHILGGLTGAIAAAVEAWNVTCLAAGRAAMVISEVRDFTAAEKVLEETDGTGNATWQTSVKADYASVTSPIGQLSCVAGHMETVIPNKGIFRRSCGWNVATKVVSVPISIHPGAPVEAGYLRGAFKPADGPGLYMDERKNPGMGGSIGRFLTCQSHIGLPGQFFIGDHQGSRDAGTRAAGDSDYSMIPYARLIMKAYRLMQVMGTRLLLRRLACKTTGVLLESEAKKLDDEVTQYLTTYLTGAGDCVSARAVMDRTANVLSTKTLPFSVFILPFGYAAEVEVSLGFEKILT